ncbi:MAG TPA: hypothetical protein VGG61_04630 [Gemmataceae bacterium]|jgi:hypothetical protein
MVSTVMSEVDFIEELQMRRWAREHYVPRNKRENTWHPIVHEEMEKKDYEAVQVEPAATCA